MTKAKALFFKIVATTFFITLLFVFLINIVFDPWGEYRWINHQLNQYKLETRQTSVTTLLDKLEKDKYALVFGTSRIGIVDKDVTGEPTLNFRNTVYGYPQDVWSFLQMLEPKHIQNITRIYYQLDVIACSNYSFNMPKSRLELEIEKFTNISKEKIRAIYDMIKFNYLQMDNKKYGYHISEFGSTVNDRKTNINNEDDNIYYENYPTFDEDIDLLHKIDDFMTKRNIKIQYFDLPIYASSDSKNNIRNSTIRRFYSQGYRYMKYTEHINSFYTMKNLDLDQSYFNDSTHLNKNGLQIVFQNVIKKNNLFLMTNEKVLFLLEQNNLDKNIFTKKLANYQEKFRLHNQLMVLTDKEDNQDIEKFVNLFTLYAIDARDYHYFFNIKIYEKAFKILSNRKKKNILFLQAINVYVERDKHAMLHFHIDHSRDNFYKFANKSANTYLHHLVTIEDIDRITMHNIKFLADSNMIHDINKFQNTPVYYAIISKQYMKTSILINRGAKLNLKNILGKSPLRYTFGEYNITELLLKNGANVNSYGIKSTDNPLFYAIINNDIKLIKLLIKYKANLNYQDENGNTSLHYYLHHKNPEVLRMLLEAGADPSIENKNGQLAVKKNTG